MKADDFREIALSMPLAVESEHMCHPDFRVHKKIFATLWNTGASGAVRVAPDRQRGTRRA